MPKKKTALTIEERLQQALVPADEQPYEVPENWVWVRLGSLYEVNPKNKAADELDAAFIPMEKISAGMLSEYSYETQEWCKAKKGHTQFADGDVAFAKISPCFENRKSMMLNNLPNSIGGGTTELIILRNASINQKYTFWLVSDERFIRGGVQTYSGTVGQQRINMDYVRSYPIPLPPLSEQQRIVERIEELFDKLDEAKERLQEVADSFAVRKAAILHKAFTGELTKQWRRENGVSDESWEEKTLQDVCSMKITDGTHKTPVYCDSEKGVKFLSAKDITAEKICWDNIKYIVPELHEELYKRLAPQVDDVLLAKNGTTGVAAIVETDDIFDIYVTLAVLRPEKSIIYPLYLLKVVNSPLCKEQFAQHLTGIGVPNLHLRDIKEVLIPLPTIPEQHEIVRLIDDLLDMGYVDDGNINEVIDRVGAVQDASMTGYLLEAKRERFGAEALDFDL